MTRLLNVKKATSLTQRVQGLIGKDEIIPLYLKTRFGIHTFFVKHSIDIIVLDKKFCVVTYKQSLSPWRIYVWNPKYTHVVELPQGTIYKKKIKPGQHIEFI